MRRASFLACLSLATVLAAAPGCGDDTAPQGGGAPATPTTPDAPAGASPTATERPQPETPTPTRPRVHEPAKLPSAPPVQADGARATLRHAAESNADIDGMRAALLYLAELRDADLAADIRRRLLAKDAGAYVDDDDAAVGLEVLLALGDAQAAEEALALARALLADEEASPAIAQALARVDGARRADAEALLAQIAVGDDPDAALFAVEALAAHRSTTANAALSRIAGDASAEELLRGSALAGLLAAGDAGAAALAERLAADADDGSALIDGLAVAGVREVVPYVQKLVERGFAEGNADFEFESACTALATVYGDGADAAGAAQARQAITDWLRRDGSLDGDVATVALWRLGDDARGAEAAKLLAYEVANHEGRDPDVAIELLEEVARRGLADDPRFAAAVRAAAALEPSTSGPGLDLAAARLRAAAAYAFLKSSQR